MKKLLILLLPLFLIGCKTANGEKVGKILDVYESGVIFNTWECTLVTGGLEDGSGVFGRRESLTIRKNKVLLIAKEAMINGKTIIVRFHKHVPCPLQSDSECFFIDDIQYLE